MTVMRAVACVPSPNEMAFTSFTTPAPETFRFTPSNPASARSTTNRGGSTSENVVNDGGLDPRMVTSEAELASATSIALMTFVPAANVTAGARMRAAERSVDLRMARSRRAFARR